MGKRSVGTMVLGVLTPLVVLALAAAGLLSLEDLRDQTAKRLAGKEVEGKVRPAGVVAYIDGQMNRRPQHMVLLGDSLAHADVHHEPLAKQLGVHPNGIARISIPGSGAPTWYAVLDNHVYGKGHRPDWIVVVASLPSMLEMRPASPAHEVTLRTLLDGDDPLVEQRLRGNTPSWWTDLRIGRAKARTRFLDGVRGGVVGWLFAPPDQDVVAWGASRADRASAKVFDQRQIELHLTRSIAAGADPRLEVVDLDALPAVADSWIPDLIRLARQHGSKVAFFKPPVAPTMPPEGWDRTTPSMAAGLAEAAADPDVWFYDDSRLDLSPAGYRDQAHMAEGLSRRYGMLVGSRIALGDLPTTQGTPVLSEATAREGPATRADHPEGRSARARTVLFDLSFLRPVADRAILAGGRLGADCMPIVATQGDDVLPPHPDGCAGVMNDELPSTCFDGTHLWARPDHSDRPVSLADHPTGRCDDGRRWLRPGDALRWSSLAASQLHLVATSTQPLRLTLEVERDGQPPLRRRWAGKLLEHTSFDLPPAARTGAVTLRNDADAGAVLVLEATTR